MSKLTYKLIHESVGKAIDNLLQDKSFQSWKKTFNSYLKQEIDELQANYLDKLSLRIKINTNYDFKGRKARWLAVYQKSTRETITSRTTA